MALSQLRRFWPFAAVTPVTITCVLAVYFAVFRPEKLQSEEYQIRHEALELIKEKGSRVEISPASLEVIANPVHQQLAPRK